MILHIPHSSTVIPKEYRSLINLTDEELAAEHRYMCDMYTDELFDYRCTKIIAPISRLICDVERFENDADEEMAAIGMGVCYTHDHNLCQFKTVTPEHREEILKKYYRPHHKTLERETDADIIKYGYGVIIDCHSFSSTVLPYEKNNERPDICIGLNEINNEFSDYVINKFKERFKNVEINKPFSGSIIPTKYINKNKPIISIMIEINRSLYMNERTGKKNENFKEIKKFLFNTLKEIEEYQKSTVYIAIDDDAINIDYETIEKIAECISINKPLNKIKKQTIIEVVINWLVYSLSINHVAERKKSKSEILIDRFLLEAYNRKQITEEETLEYFKNKFCFGKIENINKTKYPEELLYYINNLNKININDAKKAMMKYLEKKYNIKFVPLKKQSNY